MPVTPRHLLASVVRLAATACGLAFAAAPGAAQPTPTPPSPPAAETAARSVTPPRVTEAAHAPRTAAAAAAGVHGAVVLRLRIDEAGRVAEVEVVEGLGHGLDEAAAEAARGFRFAPARRDGVPVPARVLYAHPFPPAAPAPPPAATPPARPAAPVEDVVDVVVTGARVRERADQAVIATEVLDRTAIERSGARDAAELLEENGALQIERSFRGAGVLMRGLDPEYTLVLVDGDRLPGVVGGVVDLSRFGVEDIERVEVVRGPSSALYGSEAIGGVVNLITRDSDRDLEGDVMASGGTNGTVDVTGRVAVRPVDTLSLQVTGGYHRADAFAFGDAGEATSGSARRQWSLGGRARWQPSRAHRLTVDVDSLRLRLEGVDTGAGGAVFDRTQLQEQARAAVAHRFEPGGGVTLETRATWGMYREQYLLDQRGGNRLDDYEDNAEHLAQITTLLTVVPHAAHRLTVGFEQIFQHLASERLSAPGRRGRFAVFAEDRWEVAEWLTVAPGVRVDVDSQFGEQVSPKLALRADPTEGVVVRASYGRGFRAPSFQELLLRFENPTVGYVVVGNPDLGAERSHGVDLAVEWRPLAWLDVSTAFFRNDLEDMITVVTGAEGPSGTTLTYANLETAWTMGSESSVGVRAGDVLTLRGGYVFTATRDGENDRELEGVARHRASGSLVLGWAPWDVELVARTAVQIGRVFYVDEDGDGAEDRRELPALAQLDVRLAKRFGRHLELFAGVDNVFDAGDAFTVFRPRTFYGGARGRY